MSQDLMKQVKTVLWQILLANLFVATAKVILGTIIESASMTADGFHSFTDGVSNIIGLIGLSLAAKPVDPEHPYGHKKYEFLTSLCIGGMLLAIAVNIWLEAIGKFANPPTPKFGLEAIAALIITLVINMVVCVYENRQGKRLNSYILISDSLHTKSDIFVSLGVLLTLIGIRLGAPPIIDPLASMIISGFIIYAGIGIIKATSDILVDTAAIDHTIVKAITLTFSQVIDVHSIRSRGSQTCLFIDMHLVVDPAMSIEESHTLVHNIENKLKLELNQHIQVIIHTEPHANTPT